MSKNIEENNYETGLKFKLIKNKGYSVTKGEFENETLIIPETYEGLPVIEIEEEAFRDCNNILKIIIPESIEIIKTNAFINCNKIKELVIPNKFIKDAKNIGINIMKIEVVKSNGVIINNKINNKNDGKCLKCGANNIKLNVCEYCGSML